MDCLEQTDCRFRRCLEANLAMPAIAMASSPDLESSVEEAVSVDFAPPPAMGSAHSRKAKRRKGYSEGSILAALGPLLCTPRIFLTNSLLKIRALSSRALRSVIHTGSTCLPFKIRVALRDLIRFGFRTIN